MINLEITEHVRSYCIDWEFSRGVNLCNFHSASLIAKLRPHVVSAPGHEVVLGFRN